LFRFYDQNQQRNLRDLSKEPADLLWFQLSWAITASHVLPSLLFWKYESIDGFESSYTTAIAIRWCIWRSSLNEMPAYFWPSLKDKRKVMIWLVLYCWAVPYLASLSHLQSHVLFNIKIISHQKADFNNRFRKICVQV
jgi:hypothetical protein